MRNLLNFLARFNNLIIFLILEGITLYLLSTGNSYHNTRVVKTTRGLAYRLEQMVNNSRNYLRLREINQVLAIKNANLLNSLENVMKNRDSLFFSVRDTIHLQQYVHTSAQIVNNTINRQKNFFTLNKGKNQGLGVDMAVVADDGAAGIIVGCSQNFSVAMSLLNIDFRLSARIKSNGYFGSLTWDGNDYRYAVLSEIPQHVTFGVGDTIETTGYSAVFPEGVMIGTINDFERSGGDFYRIRVLLKTDFKRLHYLDVIGNLKRNERLELEEQFR
ncbi:MAG TPA: rod shape-determining protein MreC [Bacteroidales bacterium]|jgi:rod shape-determining protein MreC|nr:rod shape-determining protein MreC [Bacteroidales bacterium]OQB63324.1 MAG: Cell shape-determining protein MreC precursor [Bacteroidetes bacterium ADurb.Bin145]HOU01756.1 rod shape-determining protein MreC [Bacteroidales bacterium]HQG62764.1 rod shape-determining protein MreC [Bacteroidales bacterium]HQK68163.1 rod shape-determining protein MreC [Bacteroidales bacterium]